MKSRKLILVIAGSALLGIGLGTAINGALAGRIKRTQPTRSKAAGAKIGGFWHRGRWIVSELSSVPPIVVKRKIELPPVPPPPREAAPVGTRSPDGYWVMAPPIPSKGASSAWMRTTSSIAAERELAWKIILDRGRDVAFGTNIDPESGPKPGTAALRSEIAAAFAAACPVPPARLASYAWVDQNAPGMKIVGWGGKIMAVEPSPQGAVVTISFSPTFKHTATMARCCTEQWLYANGDLQWLSGDYRQKPGIWQD
jgi:hypothetical protein